ncbi:34-dihydroxy-2-butanone 4-phosphate synthase protein [Diplodia corticola]|uniref:34-dihydroxy-2-butanone 4-phosphate synthase protein n=1 Tax=Diplodia corticola TaxID=236234 RepID=A0A1J9R0Y2_9PEZI|nr:34-dihydroxy-2-butanone 4-phosphate synthase protein [Diplodia corticola]OJD34288.1 34-dihydroxy-2-butanone 4-phosphate synthase protein [Diplodia corticola]
MSFSLLQALFALSATAATAAQTTYYLTTTAIVTDPATNVSALQCWRFTTPLEVPSTPGITGTQLFQLNLSSAAEYTVIPPRFDGGLHNAPHNQLVAFTSGLAHITLPGNSTDEAWVVGGETGLIVAVDTVGSGHYTRYPTDQATVAFALPFENDEPPPHEVNSTGACDHRSGSQLVL